MIKEEMFAVDELGNGRPDLIYVNLHSHIEVAYMLCQWLLSWVSQPTGELISRIV